MRNDENEEELEAIETAGSAAETVASMSPERLTALKAIVDAEAGKRSQPNLGAMSEQEFQAFKAKHGL